MVAKILLVEDNPLTLKGLSYLLEREQYQVATATDSASALALIQSSHYDLVLLDVSLPDGNGFDLARILRAHETQAPFIFITALDDEADVVQGLELGADDYITKPFRNRELLLRIRNVLERSGKSTKQITVGDYVLDLNTGDFIVSGKRVPLTALERRLLRCLMENAGRVVTRERLLDEIWDASGKVVNDNTLSVYLKRLRQKLGDSSTITTIKNIGYSFAAAEEQR